MKRNKLFSRKQYGFLSGRSVDLQLLDILEKWTEALDNGNEVDCIYTDFMNAFDTVRHFFYAFFLSRDDDNPRSQLIQICST